MRPHRLRDDQWDLIKGSLPGRAGSVGVTAADNRLFVDAVLHRYRTGIPWRDLPESFGGWNNTHRRWSRWAQRGVWAAILSQLAEDGDNEYAMIDSTIVRAHQHSAGAQKNRPAKLTGEPFPPMPPNRQRDHAGSGCAGFAPGAADRDAA
jgi:transposase